jgi:hypothetical protein
LPVEYIFFFFFFSSCCQPALKDFTVREPRDNSEGVQQDLISAPGGLSSTRGDLTYAPNFFVRSCKTKQTKQSRPRRRVRGNLKMISLLQSHPVLAFESWSGVYTAAVATQSIRVLAHALNGLP